MFKDMRRGEKLMGEEDLVRILKNGRYGVLGTLDEEGYPNVTPLNYAYDGKYIYFHGASEGKKIDNIRHEEKVSFVIVDYDKIIPDKFDTHYDSVVVFGRAEELDGDDKIKGLRFILDKYSKDYL